MVLFPEKKIKTKIKAKEAAVPMSNCYTAEYSDCTVPPVVLPVANARLTK